MSDVDEVKSRLNIVDIIGQRVKLKRAGRNFKGLCPFHNEKTPSFMVSPDRQSFHCFGCAKGGSVIDFVMEYEHLEFREALEDLAEVAGVKLERQVADSPEGQLKAKILEVNHLATEYYHFILVKHTMGEKARLYLKQRGVTDKTIETFQLGYSPNSWDALRSFLTKKGYDDQLLERAGLLVTSNRGGYDRFRGRVMFTLKDHRGNVVGFSGRLLDPEAKEAKYINTSETPVYSKSNVLYGLDVTKGMIQKANEAIVMEGEFDVISSFQEGVSNVVAIKGSALTEGHIRLLRRYTENITFALDSDMAGDAASRRGIEMAESAGLQLKVVELPGGKDPDDAARENSVTFKKAIKEAVPIYDYLIRSSLRRHDITSVFGKKKAGDELLPMVAKIENTIVQAHYIKELAGVLGVTEETIVTGMKKLQRFPASARGTNASEAVPQKQKNRSDKLELYLLAWLLQGKTADLMEEFLETITLPDLKSAPIRRVIERLQGVLAGTTTFLLKDFLDDLPAELAPTVDEAMLWDLSEYLDDAELAAREWIKATGELQRLLLRDKIKVLTEQLKALEADPSADPGSLTALEGQISQFVQNLRAIDKSRLL